MKSLYPIRALMLLPALVLTACPNPDQPIGPGTDGGSGIGTWPTPEAQQPIGDEACDGADNDGDGSIDEGCACSSDKPCTVVSAGQCFAGMQTCSGVLQECEPSGAALASARPDAIVIATATPASVTQTAGETVRVELRPTIACDAIAIPAVRVTLSSALPEMRITATARDDGVAPDTTAGDGLFTVELVQPFGAGIPPQSITVTGAAMLGEQIFDDSVTIELVAP